MDPLTTKDWKSLPPMRPLIGDELQRLRTLRNATGGFKKMTAAMQDFGAAMRRVVEGEPVHLVTADPWVCERCGVNMIALPTPVHVTLDPTRATCKRRRD